MNWQRPHQTLEITKKLKEQTVESQVFVWNNNPDMLYEDPNSDLIINSNKNIRCGASLLLMPYVMGGCIVKLDDDLIPSSKEASRSILDGLEEAEKLYGKNKVVMGLCSENWQHNGDQINLPTTAHGKVDCVKGRLWAIRRETLANLSLFDIFKEDHEQSHHWEMPVTAALHKEGVTFYNNSKLFNFFRDKWDERVAASHEGSHYPNRNALRKKYYPVIHNG